MTEQAYKSLTEKVINNPTLKKGLKKTLEFIGDTTFVFDDFISPLYRSPTAIRKFLNRQSYSLRKETVMEDGPGIIGGVFGSVVGIMFISSNIMSYYLNRPGELFDSMNVTSTILAGTNLISLAYETGRIRQSREERSSVLNEIKRAKERRIEEGRYDLESTTKIKSKIPENSLYLITESRSPSSNWSNMRETIVSSKGIVSEKRYRSQPLKKKQKKKREERN